MLSKRSESKKTTFEKMGYDLEGDSDLFLCYNEDFEPEAQMPHLICGHQVEAKLLDGHYRIEYYGPNETSKKAELERLNAENALKAQEEIKQEMARLKTEGKASKAKTGEVKE